jgi:hypothetical protein
MIAGALLNAVMVGAIADVMSNLNKKNAEFQKTMDNSMSTMQSMGLPMTLINEVLDFITSQYKTLKQQEDYENFEIFISPSIKRLVNKQMYVPKLEMNYIFNGRERIQMFLFEKIKTQFMKPEEDVVSDGTEGNGFYIINKGTCTVFVNDEHRVL